MTFKEYVEKAMITKNPKLTKEECLGNAVMGMAGETGEVVDIVKKHLYQGHELDVEHIQEELGDVFWYIALLVDTLGIDIDEILEDNIQKLEERYKGSFAVEKSIERVDYK